MGYIWLHVKTPGPRGFDIHKSIPWEKRQNESFSRWGVLSRYSSAKVVWIVGAQCRKTRVQIMGHKFFMPGPPSSTGGRFDIGRSLAWLGCIFVGC